ncbi:MULTISPECIES: helix-turn-helix domain-containing protein [Algoriphagus]|uniref:Transcriptional regulator with XRE-family HTH domain n=2 Tax=Algoriphagus TaxID=246875 RepID=A0A841MS16_9BACT|nr:MULTISPECIES: helix-turn-helix domain-containing protein [Algoriphagus]MBB6326936.1 transcriptional regulator with XRE-family HTH domain [Algoriphagus iocasae]SMP17024.1 DNA-binding transcriptional regulator, XRE-family HTH domain [Algoriphagus winogradskyi]
MTENQRIKIIRKFLGMTQVDFGASIGLTQAGYSDIERGKNNVSGKIKIMLKQVHQVNLAWLESGDGEMIDTFIPTKGWSPEKLADDQKQIENLKLEIDRLNAENKLYRDLLDSKLKMIATLEERFGKE